MRIPCSVKPLRPEEAEALFARPLVIVAHPDDETLGAGALLQRAKHPGIVFCTDGAPADPQFWHPYNSRDQYREVRRLEAQRALEEARVSEVFWLPVPDQGLHLELPLALQRLASITRDFAPSALVTHAYEGGHPDHDSCALLVTGLGTQLELPVWEFPLYHRSAEGFRAQSFSTPGGPALQLDVSGAELDTKRRMAEAYASQTAMLEVFDLGVERFRRMSAYDFRQPPAVPAINYEEWRWPVTAAEVSLAFAQFLDERPDFVTAP